ncbi:hypothetical protein BCR42DRAFT_456394 [Absidia repens]|uniref:Uncharacterized protein n=1 Tax=Absidia repens TaxID=90262 RepID=A0A1X2I007_9FUNG|nr:hypothetical protein BCR42DRAFT_456394 [Absidia repens]
MTITRTIYGIDAKTKSIREAKLDLLLTKLPRNRLLNLDKIGEVELQTTYYDAFLSEIIADQDRNHDFGYPVGFGEVKPGNSSTTKHSVCMDTFFGWESHQKGQSTNGIWQHKHLYTMTEIGAMTVASSLSELHSFASLKNLDMLSSVGHCFWNHCNATDATPTVESTGIDDDIVVPISDFYALIDKSRNKARGMSSRY